MNLGVIHWPSALIAEVMEKNAIDSHTPIVGNFIGTLQLPLKPT